MEYGIIFEERPEPVIDLGTGHSNVHTNIAPFTTTDENGNEVTRFIADVERVNNEDLPELE